MIEHPIPKCALVYPQRSDCGGRLEVWQKSDEAWMGADTMLRTEVSMSCTERPFASMTLYRELENKQKVIDKVLGTDEPHHEVDTLMTGA